MLATDAHDIRIQDPAPNRTGIEGTSAYKMEFSREMLTPRSRRAPDAAAIDDDPGDDPGMVARRTAVTTATLESTRVEQASERLGLDGRTLPRTRGSDLRDEIEEETSATSLNDDEVQEIVHELLQERNIDAAAEFVFGRSELERLVHLSSDEEYDQLEPEDQAAVVHQILKFELNLSVLGFLSSQSPHGSTPAAQAAFAQGRWAALQELAVEHPTYVWLTTTKARPGGSISRWSRITAARALEPFYIEQAKAAAQHADNDAGRKGGGARESGTRLYLRTGEQASAMAEFPRSSSRERPETAQALELFGKIDSILLLTDEDGMSMRNVQHAVRSHSWLQTQYASWSQTMYEPMKLSGAAESDCVAAFFKHIQRMFNMPNLYRMSLQQLKQLAQIDVTGGASFVLQWMQARAITMQLADRTGRSQWEFISNQACGDQIMRKMLPDYLRQFLLVAAADDYYRECTKTGFAQIIEDAEGHQTFLSLCETVDQLFAALDATAAGEGEQSTVAFRTPSTPLAVPPRSTRFSPRENEPPARAYAYARAQQQDHVGQHHAGQRSALEREDSPSSTTWDGTGWGTVCT